MSNVRKQVLGMVGIGSIFMIAIFILMYFHVKPSKASYEKQNQSGEKKKDNYHKKSEAVKKNKNPLLTKKYTIHVEGMNSSYQGKFTFFFNEKKKQEYPYKWVKGREKTYLDIGSFSKDIKELLYQNQSKKIQEITVEIIALHDSIGGILDVLENFLLQYSFQKGEEKIVNDHMSITYTWEQEKEEDFPKNQ